MIEGRARKSNVDTGVLRLQPGETTRIVNGSQRIRWRQASVPRLNRGFLLSLILLFGADCPAVTIGVEGSSEFGDARKVAHRLLDEWAGKTGN
jgi:hypothetical protein